MVNNFWCEALETIITSMTDVVAGRPLFSRICIRERTGDAEICGRMEAN